MIIDSYDKETEAIISLKDFYGEKKTLIEKCLITFSESILDYLLEQFACQEIGKVNS